MNIRWWRVVVVVVVAGRRKDVRKGVFTYLREVFAKVFALKGHRNVASASRGARFRVST